MLRSSSSRSLASYILRHVGAGRCPQQQQSAAAAAAALNSANSATAVRARSLSYIPDPPDDDTPLFEAQLAGPSKVTRLNLLDLERWAAAPTEAGAVASAQLLAAQLPARLANHVGRLAVLQASAADARLRALIADSAAAKAGALEVAEDWRLLLPLAGAKAAAHFEAHLYGFRERLEDEMGRMMARARELTEADQGGAWWRRDADVRVLNSALDLAHWYILGLRLMLTQHSAGLSALQEGSNSGSNSSGSSNSGGGNEAGSFGPGGVPRGGIVSRAAPLRELLIEAAEDVRALTVEKNSNAPGFEVTGGDGVAVPLVVPYFEFALREVLKNAMQAVVDRYGAWDVDDAPPVALTIDDAPGGGGGVRVSVTDRGLGVPPDRFTHMFDYFWSSNSQSKPAAFIGYGYSRAHGAAMQGLGTGVPVARALLYFMGGQAKWETDVDRLHTTVEFTLPRGGFVF